MPAPRVWSRDDIKQAAWICTLGGSQYNRDEGKEWADRICRALEWAERNAVLEIAQPRASDGRFAPKPKLHDSPVVIEARAG